VTTNTNTTRYSGKYGPGSAGGTETVRRRRRLGPFAAHPVSEMSLKVPKANNIQLFKDGYKQMSGLEDAVLRNIEAVSELSNLVRTSFGPNGRNKLVINHLGRLFVTSDAATIIREIEVVHPAAKLLVMASQAQETEVGPVSIRYVGPST